MPLGQSDLIRNFVFMQVPVGDQDEFDETLWKPIERQFEDDQGNIDEVAFSAFLRDYLMRGGRYVSPGETFEAFQRHYEATEFDPKQVAAELKQASGWYAILQGRRPDPNPEVEAALEGLRRLDSSTTSSLLLNLYQRRHRGQLGDRDLAEALRLLSGFILRRLVCSESSRAYARMFVQAIPALGDDAVEGLRRFLEARGFPDTPRFVEAFARFNLYGSRYKKAVLEALERAYEHKEPVVLDRRPGRARHAPDPLRALASGPGAGARAHPLDLAAHAGQPDADRVQRRAAQQAVRGEAAGVQGQQHRHDPQAGRVRDLGRGRDRAARAGDGRGRRAGLAGTGRARPASRRRGEGHPVAVRATAPLLERLPRVPRRRRGARSSPASPSPITAWPAAGSRPGSSCTPT